MDAFGGSQILKKNYRGIGVAFIGINDFQKGTDYKIIFETISKLKSDGFLVVASIHFGDEYSLKHSKRQETFSHNLVDAGAIIIIGHHSHTVQEIEYYKDIPIIYGLGNYIFDQKDKDILKGRAILFSIGKDGVFLKPVDFSRNTENYSVHFLDPK